MLSAVAWVPRGASREEPLEQELSPAELAALAAKTQLRAGEEDEEEDDEKMGAMAAAEDEEGADDAGMPSMGGLPEGVDPNLMKELKMDDYDEEEEGATMFLGGAALTVHGDNSEDPYVTVPDGEDDSDEEDIAILPTDGVVLIGRTEEEQSTVEVQVYDEEEGSLYVHHDIAIPSFPLALAWMNAHPLGVKDPERPTGSYVAVGTFEPGIEIWNLDVLNVMEPVCVLGGREEPSAADLAAAQAPKGGKGKKKKKRKQKQLKELLMGSLRPGSHSDAVMSLSWHKAHPERLASGGADTLIKLWDVTTQQCAVDLSYHGSKVQTLEWNPAEPQVLLSGAYDRRVAVMDVRAPERKPHMYEMDSDLESVVWNPSNPAQFLASSESGMVVCHDVRQAGKGPVFSLRAHSQPCTSVSFSQRLPGLAVTTSLDKTAKVWYVGDGKPRQLASKELSIGRIFCSGFDYESPCTVALGGDKGQVCIWDLHSEEGVREQFSL